MVPLSMVDVLDPLLVADVWVPSLVVDLPVPSLVVAFWRDEEEARIGWFPVGVS